MKFTETINEDIRKNRAFKDGITENNQTNRSSHPFRNTHRRKTVNELRRKPERFAQPMSNIRNSKKDQI